MLEISAETFERFRAQALREKNLLSIERRRLRTGLLRQDDNEAAAKDRGHHGWIVLRERMLMDAIHRIDQSRFGICTQCSNAVGKERLFRDICQQLCTDCAALRAT